MTDQQKGPLEEEREQSPLDALAPVRYSLPRMLEEVARDRESVRDAGKLLSQEQIGAVFATHREKNDDA
jgi:hypothetical protein